MTDRDTVVSATLPVTKAEEGFRPVAYRDTRGIPTLGYGRTDGVKMGDRCTEAQACEDLRERLEQVFDGLNRRIPWWSGLDLVRRVALMDMGYQLGVGGLLGFASTIQAIKGRNWTDASEQMLASRWADQTPERARRRAADIRTGVNALVHPPSSAAYGHDASALAIKGDGATR